MPYTTKSPKETIKLGKKLAARLKPGDNVLLFGDLGAGKTHFTKGIAAGLGVKDIIKSPTYAYVNKYSLKCECESQMAAFYHYDLYRLSEGDDFTSIGLGETLEDPSAINVVEWADRMGEHLPENYISVNFESNGDIREIDIKFISPKIVPANKIDKLYALWVTPLHIREHCKAVASVAMQIADGYIKKDEVVNKELLYSAAMLHDLHRICDIKELNKSGFKEEVTDEMWSKWMEFREKYPNMHHSEITFKVLSDMSYTDTAEVIRLHMSKDIILEPKSYDTLEKKIMYYSDKRVKHREVVDLKERFRDGFERYGKFDSPEGQKLFDQVEKATFELEKELFDGIGIKPEEIK